MALSSMNSEVFLSELMKISSEIIWKNKSKASEYESEEYSIEVEQFMTAKKGLLTFETIYEFDMEVLIKAGVSEEIAEIACTDSSYIPEELRSKCTELQIQYILDNYEEMNNYYRMLYGLPDIEDTEFIYNTKYIDLSRTNIPIHELELVELLRLEKCGYIDELKEQYPTKKYLRYLTSKKIEPYVARIAEPFSILYINSSEYENMLNDFKEAYDGCRYSIMTYYTNILRKNNQYYDNFIAISILFMTLGLMHYKYLDSDIDREFYDKDSIRIIYESYGLPFYADIPLEYHIKIAKNINRLLSYKGSTRVFYEIFDLFGFGSTDIYEYYIMKSHKFQDGKPVFSYKDDGTLDNRAVYDIKFGKVRLYDNPQLEMSDSKNQVPYEDIISSDPYWISDESLLDKLYDGKYNYKESKYIGIQTVFDITKIMYEGAFYFKLIFDNKGFTEKTMVYVNFVGKDVSIFDIILYACALFGKRYGYCATIADSPHTISKVLGYDFKKNLTTIRNAISESELLKDDTGLLSLLKDMDVSSLASINSVYLQINDLRKYIVKKLCSVHDRKEYSAYYELYMALMYSNYIDDVYTKRDGTLASSFEDLLADRETSLTNRLNSDIDLDEELSNVLILLKTASKNLKYIEMSIGINIDLSVSYLMRIINLLKSAKSELLGFNIVYTITSRSENMMKLLCLIQQVYDEQRLGNEFQLMEDAIEIIHDIYSTKLSVCEIIDNIEKQEDLTYLSSYLVPINDMIKIINEIILEIKSDIQLTDFIEYSKSKETLKDSLTMSNKMLTLYDEIVEVMIFTLRDEYEKIDDIISSRFSSEIIRENLIDFVENLTVFNFEHFACDLTLLYTVKDQFSKEMFSNYISFLMSYYFSSTEEKRFTIFDLNDGIKSTIYETYNKYNWKILFDDIVSKYKTYQRVYTEHEINDIVIDKLSIYNPLKEKVDLEFNHWIERYFLEIPLLDVSNVIDIIKNRTDESLYKIYNEINDLLINELFTFKNNDMMLIYEKFINVIERLVIRNTSFILEEFKVSTIKTHEILPENLDIEFEIKSIEDLYDFNNKFSILISESVFEIMNIVIKENFIILDEFEIMNAENHGKSKFIMEDRLIELYSVKIDEA